jgi:hypothetical protein
MATTTFSTVVPIPGQPQQINLEDVSPDQDRQRMVEALDLLERLQVLLIEGDNPGIDLISNALQKLEELSYTLSHQSMDPMARKTLEDINVLLVSARQMGRNKGFADRLQKIAQETQKALEASRGVDVSAATKEATEKLVEFINNWRPVFYLLLNSRDFRVLITDSITIARRIAYLYSDIKDEATDKFAEGESLKKIATDVKEELKDRDTPEMSEEEWDNLQEDIQRVLVLLAKEPSYQQGIERIFTLLDMFQNSLMGEEMPTTGKFLPEDIHVRRVVLETEELVASFSGRETLDRFKFHLRKLIVKIQQNENLRGYLGEMKQFVLKAKSENEIMSSEFKNQSKQLANRGRGLMREFKEEDDLKNFLNAASDMLDNIKNDEFLRVLRHQAGIVQSDLSYVDNEGVVQLDKDMLYRLQSVLLPTIADALKYIPVPRISSSNPYREFWLDKIVLCSYDIIPENIHFHLETDSELSLRDIEVTETHTHLIIELDRLLTILNDVEFYYHKKTFPELEDSGRVTFRVKGNGAKLTLTYNVNQDSEKKSPVVTEGFARFDISELEIVFDSSTLKHSWLVPMLTAVFKTQIKQQIEYQVETNLTGFMAKLGDMMTSSIGQLNRPFLSSIEAARNAVKSSQLGKVYEKRREILE